MVETIEKSVFDGLYSINVNDNVEKKQKLSYLSWAWAWAELKKNHPDSTYEIIMFDNKPYTYDELTGYMVMTELTVDGLTHKMWLPVMDGANKAMKSSEYKYTVKGWNGADPTEKTVLACTMFDINKTIMRCLVKNIAMFGLGLYIYAGEDLPEDDKDGVKTSDKVEEKRVYSTAECKYCKEKKIYRTHQEQPKPQFRCECGASGWLNGDKTTWKDKK